MLIGSSAVLYLVNYVFMYKILVNIFRMSHNVNPYYFMIYRFVIFVGGKKFGLTSFGLKTRINCGSSSSEFCQHCRRMRLIIQPFKGFSMPLFAQSGDYALNCVELSLNVLNCENADFVFRHSSSLLVMRHKSNVRLYVTDFIFGELFGPGFKFSY